MLTSVSIVALVLSLSGLIAVPIAVVAIVSRARVVNAVKAHADRTSVGRHYLIRGAVRSACDEASDNQLYQELGIVLPIPELNSR